MKWTEKEEEKLKKEYAKGKKEDLEKMFNRSWTSIQCKASKLGIKKDLIEIKGRKISVWSNKEIEFLKNNYSKESADFLLSNLLGRTLSSIYNKAHLLGLNRDKSTCDLSILLKENCESYYWIGFLMADGHFSKTGQIQVNLSKKDLEHLIKFSNFIGFNRKLEKPSIYVGDIKVVEEIKNKFNIKNNKTYAPCNISNIKDEDLLFSLIVGFIDGDGSIKESNGRTGLYIKCHISWIENLQFFNDFLCRNEEKKYKTVINKKGLACTWITDLIILKNIKRKAIELNLPILQRKWEKINLNKKNKKEISKEIMERCYTLFSKKATPLEVIKQTGYSSSVVYKNFGYWKDVKMDKEINN